MRQRRPIVRRLAGAVAMLMVAAGLVMIQSSPVSADTIPPTRYSPVTLTGMSGGVPVTHPDGSVTVVCNTSTLVARSFSATGVQTQQVNFVPPGYGDTCNGHAVIGQDGTLFLIASLNGNGIVVQAYKDNGLVWTHPLGCGRYNGVLAVTLGVDGNLYLVTVEGNGDPGCSFSRLIGLSAMPQPGTTVPQVLFNKPVYGWPLAGGLSAYTDGLALFRQTSVQYIDYDGNEAGLIEAGAWVMPTSETQSAVVGTGRVFLPIKAASGEVSSCTGGTSDTVSRIDAYEPSGKKWEYELPACSVLYEVRATPSGGVVFKRYSTNGEQQELIMLNAAGKLLWRYDITPPEDGSNYNLWGASFAVDLNGNVAVHASFNYRVSLWGSYYQFPAVRLMLFGGGSGSLLESFELSGDRLTTSSNGYRAVSVNGQVHIAANTAYMVVHHCTVSDSCETEPRLYAVELPGAQLDYPRGAILGESSNKTSTMTVVGDSFSAGIGSLQPGQSYTDANCSRSPSAYGPRLAENPVVKLHMPVSSFLACSGAVTADVLSNQVGSIPQNTKSVFLTVGGNNVGFSRFGALCIFLDCATQGYEQEFDAQLTNLPDALTDVYEAILNRAPHATVYVLGYPHIMPLQDCSNAGSGGWWLGLQAAVAANPNGFKQFLQESFGFSVAEADAAVSSIFTISNDENLAARNFTNSLNLAISDAIDGVGGSRLKFVSTNQPGSPLWGHELCSQDPYFNGLSLDFGGTFHPNAAGQNAMHQVARDALATHQPQYVVG